MKKRLQKGWLKKVIRLNKWIKLSGRSSNKPSKEKRKKTHKAKVKFFSRRYATSQSTCCCVGRSVYWSVTIIPWCVWKFSLFVGIVMKLLYLLPHYCIDGLNNNCVTMFVCLYGYTRQTNCFTEKDTNSQWTKHFRYIYHTTGFNLTYCSKTKYCMQ